MNAYVDPPQAESSKAAASNSRKTSCAECHRLKLKCDKKVPCGSCVRRGCFSICPTGTLRSTGRGKRSVLSEVPELTAIISEMGERIRQLEHAVANTHDTNGSSSSQHPLLEQVLPQASPSAPAHNVEVDAGSFSVNHDGHAIYYGPSAGAETLLSIEAWREQPRLGFNAATESFRISTDGSHTWDVSSSLDSLYGHLPSQPRAWSLCEKYFQNGCWTAMPLMQDEAVELLAQVYTSNAQRASAHQLAVVYLVFALGALVDLDLPSYSDAADQYFDLGCAAMSVTSFWDQPSVLTVQMLTLLATYYAHGGRRFTMDGAWTAISMAANMAQRLGMHRRSFADKLPPKFRYRCQALFYECYAMETIYGLSIGRPTGTPASDISCPLPPDEYNTLQPFVRINRGYRQARWRWTTEARSSPFLAFFLRHLVNSEADNSTDHGGLSRLRKTELRDRARPRPANTPLCAAVAVSGIPRTRKRALPRRVHPEEFDSAVLQDQLIEYTVMMYIHSSSFVEAMRDSPTNPLASQYAASYLAAYRSASEIIKADIKNFTAYPALFTRWWAIWKSLFNAAIIVGTVATRYPGSSMAPHAIVELFTAVDLIEKGAVSSGRAQSGLSILQRLRDKAINVYSQFSGHNLTPPPSSDVQTEEELKIFAGYTRVVAKKVISHVAADAGAGANHSKAVAPTLAPEARHDIPSPSRTSSDGSNPNPSTGPSPTSQWNSLGLDFGFAGDPQPPLTQQPEPQGDVPWPRAFDPTIVRYFDTGDPFSGPGCPTGDWGGGAGGGSNDGFTHEDAGFFFTFPAGQVLNSDMSDPSPAPMSAPAYSHQHQQQFQPHPHPHASASMMQEMHWAQFLRDL
ncbi:Zn(2)-C6 fungal-type domain-containing protein [Mycena kentingensis (nom. inval.)]|nr:Zn(2)-C6 fungal-type domain-containing protein [Mycena kentingensis (nom. inval.)]